MHIKHKSTYKLFIRFVSISLLICFNITSSGAYAMESGALFGNRSHAQRFLQDEASKEERVFEHLRLTVPSQFGNVIQSRKGKNQGLIVHIQDRHADETAQFNIANIINVMEDNYGIELLCLEGASDKLDTSYYDQFPDNKAKELTSKFYVQQGLFTGAEYYKILNSDKAITAYGVEDKGLYREHATAYQNHNANTKEMATYLKALDRSLNTLKIHILSKPLRVIDDKQQAYKHKQIQLNEFAAYITEEAIKKNIPLSTFPNLKAFSQATSIENAIDFQKAESQRNDLVKTLSNILKDNTLNTLLKNSIDFKLNKISASAYYEYIENITGLNKDSIDMASYDELFAYIDYIKLSDKVDNISLFDEIEAALKNLKALYYTNDTQKLFDDYVRYVEFSIGLYDLKLTEKNVNELRALRDRVNIAQVVSFINKQNRRYGISFNIAGPPADNEAFKNALDYYELALKRDIALINNTLRRMAVSVKDSSILVAGGFHTQGIVNILKQLDMSYIVICPNIGSGDYEEIYQRQMRNQMPPPEAIFNFINNMLVHTLYTGKEMAGPEHARKVEEQFLVDKDFIKKILSIRNRLDKEKLKIFNDNVTALLNTTSKSSSAGMTRRDFIKTITIGALALQLKPVKTLTEIAGMPNNYPVDLNHLYSLSKKEGIEYIKGFYAAVKEGSIEKDKAEAFLRRVFKGEDILWMKAEAIKTLIKLGMVSENELEVLISTIPDIPVHKGIASALGEVGTEETVNYLIKWFETETDEGIKREIIFALGEAGTKEAVDHLIKWLEIETDMDTKRTIIFALGKVGTKEAVNYLIKLSKTETSMRIKREIISVLGETGTKEAVNHLIKWLKTETDMRIKREIIFALGKVETKEAVNHLIKWFKTETDASIKLRIIFTLGKVGTKEAVNYLIKLHKTETSVGTKRTIIFTLGEAGTKEAGNYLIKRFETETDAGTKADIISALGEAGTKEAENYLIERSEIETNIYYKWKFTSALGKVGTKEAVNQLIKWNKTETDAGVRMHIAKALFSILEYSSINCIQKRGSDSDEKVNNEKIIIDIITHIDNNFLRHLNQEVDRDTANGEKQLEIYFKRLRNNPYALYLILSLSQEITSHSFPAAFNYFKTKLIQEYGSFDVFKYISEQDDNTFLVPFLFTMAIFGKLEECFEHSGYTPKKLAELILPKESIKSIVDNPALFSKVIINIMAFNNQELKNAFVDRLAELAQASPHFTALIKIMLDFDFIKDSRLDILTKDISLPDLSSVWKGPQQNWISKEGVMTAGLYWSTRADSEKRHYEDFPSIFKGYGYTDIMASGDVSLEIKDEYKKKLNKYGAEKVLMKRFEQTGRVMEIYLYSSLEVIKESVHPITITRGHAGDSGNTDYPGMPGGLRFASHCRSINDSDSLIKANPDSAIITITGTGIAAETNPTLKYFFEYLGTEPEWGDWREVKEYIRPHLENSIKKYNFPNDDPSFIYAAMMKKMEQNSSKSSSAGLSVLAAQIVNPVSTQEYAYITKLAKLTHNMLPARPSAYIIERGNIFGNAAQVMPKELLEIFIELPDISKAKTYLILDVSNKELTALLNAYGLKSCDHVKSSEAVLGEIYTATIGDRTARMKALIGEDVRARLGLGSRGVNIGIVANPITRETEAEFDTVYPEPMLKRYGARVARIVLDSSIQRATSLPRALQALVKAVVENKDSRHIIDIELPPIVTSRDILEAITQYKKAMELMLQAA